MEVEGSSYSYGFLPPERHHPHGPPPPHPAEEGELWEYFPCPFCYIEVEVPFICNHLQEEHCFDTKHAVCPLCAENIGKDMAAHFRIQHSHLLKRRKPSKPSSWPTASHMNTMSTTATRKYQDPAPDPLLSQFMCSIAQNDFNSNDTNADTAVSEVSDVQRLSRRVDDGASKLELEERLQRIEFLRELLMSTILL